MGKRWKSRRQWSRGVLASVIQRHVHVNCGLLLGDRGVLAIGLVTRQGRPKMGDVPVTSVVTAGNARCALLTPAIHSLEGLDLSCVGVSFSNNPALAPTLTLTVFSMSQQRGVGDKAKAHRGACRRPYGLLSSGSIQKSLNSVRPVTIGEYFS